MQAASNEARAKGLRVGFVPTMGALHAGHLSLVDYCRGECGYVVVSIFVNPLQFDRASDLDSYPRTWDHDYALCAEHGVDAIYAPTGDAMYPQGFESKVSLSEITKPMEGQFRPGHFDGVTTVVLKLFNAVPKPHVAAFGQKDYQQLKVIQKMARDLDLEMEVVGRPTLREADGLAMSSRNVHLSADERQGALCLRRALNKSQAMVAAGELDAAKIRATALAEIENTDGARLDYLQVVDADTLNEITRLDRPARMCLAVWMGTTRLIDNDSMN